MSNFPVLVRSVSPSGEASYVLGDPLVDRYLEFVRGRCRANTLRATAFDLKTFFTVVRKAPVDVRPVDVFDFLVHQRGDRKVVRLVDGESGLSARTIARRLSSVSGFYSYLLARGDTPVTVNPVPRGLSTRNKSGSRRTTTAPLVRVPRTLPTILSPSEIDRLVGALRTDRDRAMILAMVLGGLRRCEVLGLRLADLWVGERRLFIVEGKGGHHRVVPIANRFFSTARRVSTCRRVDRRRPGRCFGAPRVAGGDRLMAANQPRPEREVAGNQAQIMWAEIAAHSPQMASTMSRYLTQAGTFLAASSIDVADNTLRQLARFLHTNTMIVTVGEIRRDDIEAFKIWLAAQPGNRPGTTLSFNTQRQRLGMLRVFFERIIEWEWDDAPRRNPVIGRDLPPRPDPLPKFLDDRDAAKLMAAARASNDRRERLIIELLARTGMRASEVCDLAADAVVIIGDGHWLRVPIGKLRNDRYVPLHPDLIVLLTRWTADNLDHIRANKRLVADHRGSLDRHALARIVRRVGRRAGVTVHPHQLPPKPSTAACASKQSPRCLVTAPCT